MTIDYLHHDSITTAAVTECGSVSCADCQLSRKTNAGWYCARLQRVVNLDGCIYFSQKVIPKPKPITNADRIRSMTDEELAEWYWWMLRYVQGYTDSRVALRDWLKEGVET